MVDVGFSVRRLQEGDAAAFRRNRLEALAQEPEAFGATLESEELEPIEWFADRLRRNAVFGAMHGGDLAGIAGFYVQSGAKVRHKGTLWGMYVQPTYRRNGAGRALVAAVIEHARAQVEILQLTVVGDQRDARRLYVRFGFTEYGLEARALKHGGSYFDEVLMTLVLR